ncbi:MAG: hypothetical protein ACTSRC_09705 [Candidatus Helarchaeota archaeon]
MDTHEEELKQRLLEIAKQQSAAIGKDINKTMQESIKLEKDEGEKSVRITFLKEQELGLMFNKENFEKFLDQFSEDGHSIEYESVEGKNYLLFKFQDEFIVNKVYDYYHYFFFGDFQAQQINKMLSDYIQDLIHESACGLGACACNLDQGESATDAFFKSLKKEVVDISQKAQEKLGRANKQT